MGLGGAIKMVMSSSGCNDAEKIEQVLLEVGGGVDAAIEYLIAEGDSGEIFNENDFGETFKENDSPLNITDNGYYMSRSSDKHEGKRDCADGKDRLLPEKKTGDSKLSSKTDTKISRNKVCPCGSKKKHKDCCGSASGRTCPKLVVEYEAESKRGKKGKQGKKKVAPVTKTLSNGSDEIVRDLGALCI